MWNARLVLGTGGQFGACVEEQIRLFKKTGFDGFFTGWSGDARVREWKALADELGMVYQSIHAPFSNAAKMWEADADEAMDELLRCLSDCAENAVPIMVVHPFIGFESHTPTREGIRNFGKLADAAEAKNVRLAFENVEGEEYLAALMEAFRDRECVGFCWDTGHEMCYNRFADQLRLYGDRLFCTHLNDNLGVRDFNGKITWLDELELVAVLHDIGKISVDKDILTKTDRLSEEDWREIKKHPEVGYRIANSTFGLTNIAEYILCHHERWDGSGYPLGLSGTKIPLISRIISVVDSYDAMTQDRGYRKALPAGEAVKEILKNKGTQFDPQIADIFVNRVLPEAEL